MKCLNFLTSINLHLIVTILIIKEKIINAQTSIFQSLFDQTNLFYFNESIIDTNEFLAEYDFIVIGSGSGGSVIANRLSEITNWNILLLEVGKEETMFTDVPLSAGFTQITGFNWGYKADPCPNCCLGLEDGVCNWPKGRGIGGTSLINFLIYVRGNKKDYDNWERLGNYGWSYKNVLPYFKKSERIGIPELASSKYHGQKGYLDIEHSSYRTKFFTTFLDAGKELGYKTTDPNGESQLGFSLAQATMRNGRRCSAGKAFIRSVINRKNLHVSMKTWVTKIVIDPITKTAMGVEFIKNRKRYFIKAKREVILSAGAIASPQLLMLSGIGPAEHLRQHGIPVIQNLKVGYNLQDHNTLSGLVFTVNQPITILDSEVLNPIYGMQYLLFSQGQWTLPGGAEGIAFVKTPNSTLDADYPDIELVIGAGGLNGDSTGSLRRLLGITDEFYRTTYKGITDQHAFGIAPVLMQPKSRGRISLKSKNPFHWPKMEANFFQHPDDMRTLIAGVKLAIQVAETKSFKKFGATLHKTPFLGCERPKFRSDEYWECCIRRIGSSLQHQSGTCKMGPKLDRDAVVNPELQVYGIKGLRVVDSSIMPVIPAAHTNAVVFMIGEKGADMIKDYWRNRL